jgi:hypothetical protein
MDKSFHLGMNPFSFRCKCWRCGDHNIYRALALATDLTGKQIRELIQKKDSPNIKKSRRKKDNDIITILPPEASKRFYPCHWNFLKEKGFGIMRARKIKRKYNLHAVLAEGIFRYRIIIPIYMNKRLVAYTGRSVIKDENERYKLCSTQDCAIHPSKLIYNYDSIVEERNAIAVEGPSDVWAVGDQSFAVLGVGTTAEQVLMLMKKKINKLFIFFDNDPPGRRNAYFFSRDMAPVCKKVIKIRFEDIKKNDPGELTQIEVEKIKKEIGFYEN